MSEHEIETINDQCVGVGGGNIQVLLPKNKMTKEEALRQAAWLVALADGDLDRFHKIYEAVMAI